MQYEKLTDDELWRAIAGNTEVMSELVQQQCELNAGANVPPDCDSRAGQMRTNAQLLDSFERQYRDYTAELRRRYL